MFEAISPGRTRVAYHFDVRSNSWLLLIRLREQRCLTKSKGVSIPITATEVARAAIARDGAAPLAASEGAAGVGGEEKGNLLEGGKCAAGEGVVSEEVGEGGKDGKAERGVVRVVGSLLGTQHLLATWAVAEAIANLQNLLRIWPSLDQARTVH